MEGENSLKGIKSMAIKIITTKEQLIWPLNQPLSDHEVKQQLGAKVLNDAGQVVNADILVMDKSVDIHQPGDYLLTLVAEDADGHSALHQIQLQVMPQRQAATPKSASEPVQAPSPKQSRHSKRWLLLGGIVIIALVLGGVLRACQNHEQQAINNADQSSQISQNSSSIKQLRGDNQKLAQQVAELRGATKQYQHDHDVQALQNTINNLKAQNQQLMSSLSAEKQAKLQQVDQAADQIAQNPDQADQTLQQLKNNGFNSMWDAISTQVSQWLKDHQ